MNLNCGIYKITNIITNDFYIGQSICLKQREQSHKSKLKLRQHENKYLQHVYNKYGEETFKFSILLYCEQFELNRYEQFFVDKLKPKYNILTLCVSSRRGTHHTEDTKLKIASKLKGRIFSEEWRKKLSESGKRRIFKGNYKYFNIKIKDPYGNIFFIEENLHKFCKIHKIQFSGISRLLRKEYKQYLGWTRVESL